MLFVLPFEVNPTPFWVAMYHLVLFPGSFTPLLLNLQCRMLASKDMEKQPQRGQEKCHTNNGANQQCQLCRRGTGGIAYRHINWDQVGKLRQTPGNKNERRYCKAQHTRQAIPPQ